MAIEMKIVVTFGGEVTGMGHKECSYVMEMFNILIMMITWIYILVKTH